MIDTHAHLNLEPLKSQVAQVVANMVEAGIDLAIVPGTNIESSKYAVDLHRKFSNLLPAIGIHPSEAIYLDDNRLLENSINKLRELLRLHEEIVAIGEVGLDEENFSEMQLELFREQLKLAYEFDLPVIVHIRGSENYQRAFAVIKNEEQNKKFKGVFHCFVGTATDLDKVLELDGFLGVNGIITYKSGESVRAVVKDAPLERLVLETDSPWLTPGPKRQVINTPSNIAKIAVKVAEVMNVSVTRVLEETTINAKKLFC